METRFAGPEATGSGLFDRTVAPGGYAWWYADAISHDGEFALTLIAFIGSVFSPYYAWSGRVDPLNHCALNVALYGQRGKRWAMTERGRNSISITPDTFCIGPSSLSWDGGGLTVDIREFGMPLPLPIRGKIRLIPHSINRQLFAIDPQKDHHWRPISPMADVEVDLEAPDLSWRGHGYFDMNYGQGPLEEAFRYWDWSRVQQKNGTTSISYTTDCRNGERISHGLSFAKDGQCQATENRSGIELPSTRIFRIRRRTHEMNASSVTLGSTLEDTPFYSRSTICSRIEGEFAPGIHESFDGDRLRKTLVKLMLPFRMPRLP